jgi:hypothetical protein
MRMTVCILFVVSVGITFAVSESGFYDLNDVLVRHAPSSKQNGSSWDPFNGAPDLFLQFFIVTDDSEERQFTTGIKENCGTSATWSSTWEIAIRSSELESGSAYLLIKVWDEDAMQSDFIDSGRISLSSLVEGENEIECTYGTDISFCLERQ